MLYCFYDGEPVLCWIKFRQLFYKQYNRWPTDKEETLYRSVDFKTMTRVPVIIDYANDEKGTDHERDN